MTFTVESNSEETKKMEDTLIEKHKLQSKLDEAIQAKIGTRDANGQSIQQLNSDLAGLRRQRALILLDETWPDKLKRDLFTPIQEKSQKSANNNN